MQDFQLEVIYFHLNHSSSGRLTQDTDDVQNQAASARMLGTVQTGMIQSFCSLTLANLPQAVSFEMLHETRGKKKTKRD